MADNLIQIDEDWEVEMTDALKGEPAPKASCVCIFNAPSTLVNQKEDVYVPLVVSVGPYFFGKPELKRMENHKTEAARRVQSRIPGNDFKSVVEKIKIREEDVRNCYDEHIPHNGHALSWMIARDGSFILEFLKRYADKRSDAVPRCTISEQFYPVFDARSGNPTVVEVMVDILKTGNQIPIFVLEEILAMEMQCSPEMATLQLQRMVESFFFTCIEFVGGTPMDRSELHPRPRTLLEMIHYFCRGEVTNQTTETNEGGSLFASGFPKCFGWMLRKRKGEQALRPTAVELNNAGVKLRPILGGLIGNLRFDWQTSTLCIPQLNIWGATEAVMRNMMVLEAFSPTIGFAGPVTPFANFMDYLIDSEKDVALLRRRGIIVSALGSDAQVAEIFNAVRQACPLVSAFGPVENVWAGLEKYYENGWKIMWSEFVEGYCSRPWLVAGSLAATLVVIMTAMQVFCLFYTCN